MHKAHLLGVRFAAKRTNPFSRGWVVALVLGLAGCGGSPSGAQNGNSGGEGNVGPVQKGGARATQGPRVDFEALYLQGAKVGHVETRIEAVEENGQPLVRTTQATHIQVRRLGGTTTQEITLTALENLKGDVVRLESRLVSGGSPTHVVARPAPGKLVLEVSTSGKSERSELAWQPGFGSFFAAEQSLRQQPLQPGEKRSLHHFYPVVNVVVQTDLAALDYETVALLEGQTQLLKIQINVRLPGGINHTSLAWCDRAGEVLRSESPGLGQVSYRTSRERALKADANTFDLAKNTAVKVARRLEKPHATRRVLYRARLGQGEPGQVFPSGLSQTVRAIDASTAEIEVFAVRPQVPPALPKVKIVSPTADDLAANNYLQVSDRRIQTLAGKAAAGESDPWKVALALEKLVHTSMRNEGFSQALVTAAETAESLTGDCTEHAMLLAALCRARQVPARVATGLVYYAPLEGFAYHMWTEVWITDRWVPLDATLGQGGIGAAHLKLSDSNLQGADALSTFLPVAQVMGNLELEILAVE